MVSGVLRFGLEASERRINVGLFERLLPLPYSRASCSLLSQSRRPAGAYDIGSPRSDEFVAVGPRAPKTTLASRRAFRQVARMSRSQQCWQLPNVRTGIDSGATVDLRSTLQS
jgi:hypothetical protein